MAYLTKFAEYYVLGDYWLLNRNSDFIALFHSEAVNDKNISKKYCHSNVF